MSAQHRRLASLVMPRVDADLWSDPLYQDRVFSWIDRGIGGVGIFRGTLERTAEMIADLQTRAGRKLLIAADFEHGLSMRITEGGIAFPRAMALGKTLPGITEHVARCIAEEARALGVHWNWAPVADINSNPQNPIVNVRGFGEDPKTVAEHALAYVTGTQSMQVLACVKHAPGHGNTAVDSHLSLPRIDIDRITAEAREFVPFRTCIEGGVRSVMMGHIIVPFLDDQRPASLSPTIVNDLVRISWGFDGLITTDALDMGAITSMYSSAQAAVLAVLAGNDVVLLPENVDEAIDALIAAYDSGEITEERLKDSERRWKDAKDFAGVGKRQETVAVDQSTHAMIALQAANTAISLVGDASLLPLTQHTQIAAFAVVDEHEADAATAWFHYLAQATELDIDMGYIDGTIEERDLAGLQEGIMTADVIVFAFFGAAVSHRGRLPGYDRIPEIMDALCDGRPRIVVACGSPYGFDTISANLTMYAYSDTTPSLAATVLRLIGRAPAA